ncbi:MAG: hypothetical protein AAGO57_07650 [Pseudomonadota bacterium]
MSRELEMASAELARYSDRNQAAGAGLIAEPTQRVGDLDHETHRRNRRRSLLP